MLVALGIAAVLLVANFVVFAFNGQLGILRDPVDADAKWSYGTWAGALTGVGGALSLIVAVQKDQAYVGVSLLCGIILLTVPLVLGAVSQNRVRGWVVVVAGGITIWAV